jgi:cardiolipin synthase
VGRAARADTGAAGAEPSGPSGSSGSSGSSGPEERSRVWTIPNLLSALRLALLPLFLWLILGPEADGLAVLVLVVSGLSDWLDGYLARKLDQASKLGAILDPVADRLYILATVVGLAARDIIPLWLALILPARDLFLWGLVPILRTRGYSALPVHFLGKAATAALLYAFPLLLLGDGETLAADAAKVFGWAFAIWGVGMYWWAGLLYAWQVRTLVVTTPRRRTKAAREHPA